VSDDERPDSPEAPPSPDQVRVIERLQAGLRRPWVTWALVAGMVAIHVALGAVLFLRGRTDLVGVLAGIRPEGLLIRSGAMQGLRVSAGEVWRLTSCVFLHGSLSHLALNMLALYGLGRICEAVYGHARFLWMFLVAGLTGATLSWLGGHELSVGASGGIFGLLGACVVFGWRYRGRLPERMGRWFQRNLLPWVGLNLFIGLVIPFIDNLAHIGGLLSGALLAAVLGNRVVDGEEGGAVARGAMAVASLGLVAWAAVGVAGKWV